MEKRFTEDRNGPMDIEFEFISDEEQGKAILKKTNASFSESRGKKEKRSKNKKNNNNKNQVIMMEFAVILVLAITIITTVFFHGKMIQSVRETMSELTEEVMLLNRDIQDLQSLQESLLTAASEETILTYDSDGNKIHLPILANVPKHPYDWTCLQSLNGRKNYIIDGQTVTKQGIDVSSFQGEIDWRKVKEDGIEFAIIRVGYRGYGTGKMVLDEYFEANIKGALEAGLEVGVYYFSQAISQEEAIEEAQVVLEQVKGYDITYPIVYDAEEITTDSARTDGVTVRQLTDNAIAFCDTIEAAGYSSMIYSNKRWLLTKLDLERLNDYKIWFAGYVGIPEYPYDFQMWQYSESGSVAGIDGNVDLNISFMDYRAKE